MKPDTHVLVRMSMRRLHYGTILEEKTRHVYLVAVKGDRTPWKVHKDYLRVVEVPK